MLETRRELIIGAYGAHWGVNGPEPAVVLHDETGRYISRCRLRDPPWTFPSSSHSAFHHCRLGYWISVLYVRRCMKLLSFLETSVHNSHFRLLLRNPWPDSLQTWWGCTLGGCLLSLFTRWRCDHFLIFYEFLCSFFGEILKNLLL